jgi:hypothetical protein
MPLPWVAAWALFLLGDMISRPMNRWDWASWLYPSYRRIMLASVWLSDTFYLNVWRKP